MLSILLTQFTVMIDSFNFQAKDRDQYCAEGADGCRIGWHYFGKLNEKHELLYCKTQSY